MRIFLKINFFVNSCVKSELVARQTTKPEVRENFTVGEYGNVKRVEKYSYFFQIHIFLEVTFLGI